MLFEVKKKQQHFEEMKMLPVERENSTVKAANHINTIPMLFHWCVVSSFSLSLSVDFQWKIDLED